MGFWWYAFIRLLDQPFFLRILFAVNLVGSLYGFYWYKNQLIDVGSWLNIFVPDSPTASAAFTVVLLLFLFRRRSPLLEAFAGVTLVKYGIWAVVMIVWGGIRSSQPFLEALHWTDWMLMTSHLGMAAQAVLYTRFFTYDWRHLIAVGAWTLLNDWVDYNLNLHPWLPVSMMGTEHAVEVFTVTLSLVCLLLFTQLSLLRKNEGKWEYPMWYDFSKRKR